MGKTTKKKGRPPLKRLTAEEFKRTPLEERVRILQSKEVWETYSKKQAAQIAERVFGRFGWPLKKHWLERGFKKFKPDGTPLWFTMAQTRMQRGPRGGEPMPHYKVIAHFFEEDLLHYYFSSPPGERVAKDLFVESSVIKLPH